MWLDGIEPGVNKGKGIDSFNRYIYIHGTHEEGLIGLKASHGCIRMFNLDAIKRPINPENNTINHPTV